MSVNAKAKTKQKASQIRINRTPAIEKILKIGRSKYNLLDDNEILKIFIGRGASIDISDTEEQQFALMSHQSFLDNNDDSDVDYTKMYGKTTSKKLPWKSNN